MLTFSQIGLLTTTSARETEVFFTRQERSDPVSPAAGSFLARRAGERQAQERQAGPCLEFPQVGVLPALLP